MNIIQNLKPVEALYLLDHAGIETMTAESSLAANLGYLAHMWFISLPENNSHTHLAVSDVGKRVLNGTIDRNVIAIIRPYEINSLKAIVDDDEYQLLSAVTDFNFKNQLTNEGYFKIENKPIIPKIQALNFITKKEYVPTEKYNAAIAELKDLKSGLEGHLSHENNRYITPMIYAFPSLELKDTYSSIAKTLSTGGFYESVEFKYPAPGFTDTHSYF